AFPRRRQPSRHRTRPAPETASPSSGPRRPLAVAPANPLTLSDCSGTVARAASLVHAPARGRSRPFHSPPPWPGAPRGRRSFSHAQNHLATVTVAPPPPALCLSWLQPALG